MEQLKLVTTERAAELEQMTKGLLSFRTESGKLVEVRVKLNDKLTISMAYRDYSVGVFETVPEKLYKLSFPTEMQDGSEVWTDMSFSREEDRAEFISNKLPYEVSQKVKLSEVDK